MLCQFNFKNFRSYKDDATIDMQAASQDNSSGLFADSLIYGDDNSKAFLPVVAVFGTNAGGKSNALKALTCLVELIIKPLSLFNKDKYLPLTRESILCTPFEFDSTSREKPTEFEIFFREKSKKDEAETEYEYRYYISILNNVILEESLHRKKTEKNSRQTCVFERSQVQSSDNKLETSIVLGPCIRKDIKNSLRSDVIKENIPYLSVLALTYNLEPINTAISFFASCISANYAIPSFENYIMLSNDENFQNDIVHIMNDMGINISGIEIEKLDKDSNKINVYFDHKVNDNVYRLGYYNESDGTQKLFNVLPYVYRSLKDGNLLIVDELDAKLHPLLLRNIIMLFKNKDVNKKGSQLIFTSHDVSIMKSSVLRPDEIWFACKKEDESSDLYSLSELRDENGNKISPNTAYNKQYLEGRYGADPIFGSMMEWK